MTRITVDDELRKRLRNFAEDLEICDDRGYVIARVDRSTPLTYPEGWDVLTPPETEEELRQALDSDEPGITTEQLLAHLRAI